MLKSVLATACAILWLSVSAQISPTKNVFSFGNISLSERPTNIDVDKRFESFKLVGGLMFVEANINGEGGTFILDTGAPGLILNKKIVLNEVDDTYIASGLTGNASISELTIDEFQILNIVESDFLAYQMDLEHIEDEVLHRFSGLVGSDLFRNSILVLDYANQEWGTVQSVDSKEVKTVIPFTLSDHFIIVDMEVSGSSYQMILDTGAEINILDASTVQEVKKSKLKKAGTTNIQSASQDHHSSQNLKLQRFNLGKHLEKNQEFSVMPFDFINEGLDRHLDGLIGFPFFENKKIAFDFLQGKLYIFK